MSQHDYAIADQAGTPFLADLNNALAAIVGNNSGATEPSTTYAYQWWADTTTGLLKIRNAANSAWVTVGTLASAYLGLAPASGATLTSVTISSGSISGITDLAIADGGTGASTAAAARANLGVAYGPAFSAYANADQSVVSGAGTPVTLGTEEFDTDNCFASSKFTPNVPGYYMVAGSVRGYSTTITTVSALIAKNGGTVRSGDVMVISSANTAMQGSVTAIVQMNGTTDYLELWGIVSGGSPIFDYNGSANSTSYFCGNLVRPL